MRLLDAGLKPRELVVDFFRALSQHAIRHPKRVLLIVSLVTLGATPGIWRLKLLVSGHTFVSPSAPEVAYDRSVRDQFGIEDQIVVLVHSDRPEGIFNSGTVQLIRDLTEVFTRIPGVGPSNVMSLATEPSFRLRPGTYTPQTLLEPPLKTDVELDQLRDDLRRIELYSGTLVSTDGHSTAILIGAPSGDDRTRLYQSVCNIIATKQSASNDIAVTGAPVAESLLGIQILEDLGVPKSLLGMTTQGRADKAEWRRPASFHGLRRLLARRIGLIPIVAIAMMLVFSISFRTVLATVLPLLRVLATTLFVFGLMGWAGVPIYLTIAVMPVLLTAICVSDDIHVSTRYFKLLREQPDIDHVELIRESFDELARPLVNTSLTTGIAFVSFVFSPIRPVKMLGLFTGIGVLFSLFYSFTVFPSMLTLINPAWVVSHRRLKQPPGSSALAAWFARLGAAVVRQRRWVVGLVLVTAALTPFGLRRLIVQDSWTDGFDPDSEFSRATRLVDSQFDGMHILLVCIDAPQLIQGEIPASALSPGRIVLPGDLAADPAVLPGSSLSVSPGGGFPGDGQPNAMPRSSAWHTRIQTATRSGSSIIIHIPRGAADIAAWQSLSGAARLRFEIVGQSLLKPEIIRAIDNLGAFIRALHQYGVGGVLSPADYLRTTRFMLRPNDPGAKVLPGSADECRLLWDYYRVARGPHQLHQVVDANYARSLTTIFLKDANFVDTARLMAAIRSYEHENLAPLGIHVGFAGDVAVSQSLIHGIVTTQMQSLFWSLLGIYLVTAMLGQSWRWGLYCVLPSALAVVMKFTVMGWSGIPLGVATSMFAAMTLGIGMNCAIHLLENYGRARANGASLPDALSWSMALTGPPVLINTIAVSLGFGVLMLSQVPANARLGMLMVLGIVECLVASMVILPVLLDWWPLKDAPLIATAAAQD